MPRGGSSLELSTNLFVFQRMTHHVKLFQHAIKQYVMMARELDIYNNDNDDDKTRRRGEGKGIGQGYADLGGAERIMWRQADKPLAPSDKYGVRRTFPAWHDRLVYSSKEEKGMEERKEAFLFQEVTQSPGYACE
ncbi:hypothetical protein M0804_001651 [Polistes exclamans]|nr:hypothetical protein M0804_001651 [Polistes exclamans]